MRIPCDCRRTMFHACHRWALESCARDVLQRVGTVGGLQLAVPSGSLSGPGREQPLSQRTPFPKAGGRMAWICCEKPASGTSGKESLSFLMPACVPDTGRLGLDPSAVVSGTSGTCQHLQLCPTWERREQRRQREVGKQNLSQPDSRPALFSLYLRCFVQHLAAGLKPS